MIRMHFTGPTSTPDKTTLADLLQNVRTTLTRVFGRHYMSSVTPDQIEHFSKIFEANDVKANDRSKVVTLFEGFLENDSRSRIKTKKTRSSLARNDPQELLARAVDSRSENGRTPLIEGIFEGNSSKVDYLLRTEADVDLADLQGQTPLMHAIRLGDLDLTRLLIERRADPLRSDERGETALSILAKGGGPEIERHALPLLKAVSDRLTWTPNARRYPTHKENADALKYLMRDIADLVKNYESYLYSQRSEIAGVTEEKGDFVSDSAKLGDSATRDAIEALFDEALTVVSSSLSATELDQVVDAFHGTGRDLEKKLIRLVLEKTPNAFFEAWRQDRTQSTVTRMTPVWSDLGTLWLRCKMHRDLCYKAAWSSVENTDLPSFFLKSDALYPVLTFERTIEKSSAGLLSFDQTIEKSALELCGPLDLEPLLKYLLRQAQAQGVCSAALPSLRAALDRSPEIWRHVFKKPFSSPSLRKIYIRRLLDLLTFISSNIFLTKISETKDAAELCVNSLARVLVETYVALAREHNFDVPERSCLEDFLENDFRKGDNGSPGSKGDSYHEGLKRIFVLISDNLHLIKTRPQTKNQTD